MMRPPWLQELRDLLAITSYDGRQNALVRWEQRWLVELHNRQLLTPDIGEQSHPKILQHTRERVLRGLGQMLVIVMVELIEHENQTFTCEGVPMREIRGDVMAIRREPKVDD